MTLPAIIDDDELSGESCVPAPVLEEVVLPPARPAVVGMMPIDRAGLVAMARRRGLTGMTLHRIR